MLKVYITLLCTLLLTACGSDKSSSSQEPPLVTTKPTVPSTDTTEPEKPVAQHNNDKAKAGAPVLQSSSSGTHTLSATVTVAPVKTSSENFTLTSTITTN